MSQDSNKNAAGIKDLPSISSKRRSLGQLKLKLDWQINTVETLCGMIDPRGDGSIKRATEQSHKDLNREHCNLQSAWDSYVARIDDLTSNDLDEEQKPKEEYKKSLKAARKEYSAALEFIFVTSQNAFPHAATTMYSGGQPSQQQGLSNECNSGNAYIKLDFHELKPSTLELNSSESVYRF